MDEKCVPNGHADAGSVCHATAEFFWETSLYCFVENQHSSEIIFRWFSCTITVK